MHRGARAFLGSFAFLAITLSGCVSQPGLAPSDSTLGADLGASIALDDPILSQVSLGISAIERLDIVSFDGVLINQYVWRPTGAPADATFPVIINSSPYWSNLETPARFGGDDFGWWLVNFFVPRGYIVALQSVRGTGESGGCFNLGGATEMKDMYETVEFFGTKYPGTNGKVAVIGKSYDGTTPHMASVLQPPHLATIVPIAGITDWYRYLNTNGVSYTARSIFNTQYTTTVDWGADGFGPLALIDGDPSQLDPTNALPREENYRNWPNSACHDLALSGLAAARTEATGSYNEWWQERNYRKDLAKVKVPVFLVHGMQDWNVKPDQFGDWYNDLTVPKRALLGQWDHSYPLRADWNVTLLRWFDWTLKGVENGLMDGPTVQIEDSSGRWRTESEWPPKRATPIDFFLGMSGTEGAATPGAPGAHATASYFDGPTNGPDNLPGGNGDVTWGTLAFETPAFESDMVVTGLPKATLFVSVDRPATRLVVTERLVAPNGTMEEVNRGFISVAHRNGPEGQPEALLPGEIAKIELSLFPEDTFVPAGFKLRYIVTGYHSWVEPVPTGGMVTLHFGGDVASKMTLPMVADGAFDAPQPVVVDHDEVPGNRPRPAPDRP
ncbi:MAG: CocE/NonD family hydrolase [Euryarchaeota archaeon]|nr:CocE/NonD family hydrolase [Euryarchaeota archaeon]